MRRLITFDYGIEDNLNIVPIIDINRLDESLLEYLEYGDIFDDSFESYVDNICEIAFAAHYAGIPVYLRIMNPQPSQRGNGVFDIPIKDIFYEHDDKPNKILRKKILCMFSLFDNNSSIFWSDREKKSSLALLLPISSNKNIDVDKIVSKIPCRIVNMESGDACIYVQSNVLNNPIMSKKVVDVIQGIDKYHQRSGFFNRLFKR